MKGSYVSVYETGPRYMLVLNEADPDWPVGTNQPLAFGTAMEMWSLWEEFEEVEYVEVWVDDWRIDYGYAG